MYEREIPLEYYTERGVQPPGLSFTGADMEQWDDDDREVAKLAMEIDRHDRGRYEITRLEREVIRLQDMLADHGIDYEERPYGYDED